MPGRFGGLRSLPLANPPYPLFAREKGAEKNPCTVVNAGCLAFARATDAERIRLHACEPRSRVRDGAGITDIGDEARLGLQDRFLAR
jgi:hypothetical protein